jgi:signal peptidase I
MTIHSLDDGQLPLFDSHRADTVLARSGPGTGPTRRTPSPDYRLRGLDLQAQGVLEPRARRARNRHESHRRHRRRRLVQATIVVVVGALVAVLLQGSVVQSYTVSSSSMVPTLNKGTGILVMKPQFLTGAVEVGDVVVVHQPADARCATGAPGADVVKRVIGLPGQTIWSDGPRIYVDGALLEEPGWYNVPFGELGTSRIPRTDIPAGSYYVLGDNRTDTCDSRAFGPVPESDVVGEVVSTITRNGHPFVHGI